MKTTLQKTNNSSSVVRKKLSQNEMSNSKHTNSIAIMYAHSTFSTRKA
jgi:hypothetical protein